MKLDNRIWAIVSVLVIVALAAGGWFLGAAPQLAALADATRQRADVEAQNAALEAQIERLRTTSGDLSDLEERAAELQASVPEGIDSADFIESLNALAAEAGVVLTEITISQAAPYTPPVAEDDAAPAEEPVEGEPLGGAPLPATSALITPDNFVVIPVSIIVQGEYGASLRFLEGLQTGPRLILVYNATLTRSADEGTAFFETRLSALVYALPGSGIDAFAATPAPNVPDPDPTGTPTPGPTSTGTPSPTPSPTSTGG